MKPENFRLKMSIKIRRNWHGVKINSSEKIDKNTIIINLIADMNKWHNFNALRSAIELSVEAITKDRQVITKIHKKGFVINKYTDDERTILPVLFINQESD
jgi:hypothetical protein